MMTAPRSAIVSLAAIVAMIATLCAGWASASEGKVSCRAHELQQAGRVGETVQVCELTPAPAPKPVKKPACRIVYINGDAVIACPK